MQRAEGERLIDTSSRRWLLFEMFCVAGLFILPWQWRSIDYLLGVPYENSITTLLDRTGGAWLFSPVVYCCFLAGLIAVIRASDTPLSDVGIVKKWQAADTMNTAMLVALGIAAAAAVDGIDGMPLASKALDNASKRWPNIAAFLVFSLLQNALYRGYLVNRFERLAIPKWVIVLLIAVVTTFADVSLGPYIVVVLFVLSTVTTTVYLRWRSIWPLVFASAATSFALSICTGRSFL